VSDDRLTYVGHATVLLEQAGIRILTDPVLRPRIGHIRRVVPPPDPAHRRDLDAVLISHAHHDHLDVPSLRRLELRGPVVAPRGVARVIRRAGLHDVIELRPGERCELGPLGVEALEAEHDGRRLPGGARNQALGYLIDGADAVYFAGDTDLFTGMEALAGRVDTALLPVSGWGPRLPPGHLGPASAARAAALIRPRTVVPIHWGTLQRMGTRLGDRHAAARDFAAAVGTRAPGTEVRILEPGESMPLSSGGGGRHSNSSKREVSA
jgi:L-ascorbate metabolism protein UlaG (beta-lactamase superfamily)